MISVLTFSAGPAASLAHNMLQSHHTQRLLPDLPHEPPGRPLSTSANRVEPAPLWHASLVVHVPGPQTALLSGLERRFDASWRSLEFEELIGQAERSGVEPGFPCGDRARRHPELPRHLPLRETEPPAQFVQPACCCAGSHGGMNTDAGLAVQGRRGEGLVDDPNNRRSWLSSSHSGARSGSDFAADLKLASSLQARPSRSFALSAALNFANVVVIQFRFFGQTDLTDSSCHPEPSHGLSKLLCNPCLVRRQ